MLRDRKIKENAGLIQSQLQQLSNELIRLETRVKKLDSHFSGAQKDLDDVITTTKKITGKPTITVGSVGLSQEFIPKPGETEFRDAEPASIENLVERMEMNEFDLAAVGRALIANPDWADLIKFDNLGRIRAFNKDMLNALD